MRINRLLLDQRLDEVAQSLILVSTVVLALSTILAGLASIPLNPELANTGAVPFCGTFFAVGAAIGNTFRGCCP